MAAEIEQQTDSTFIVTFNGTETIHTTLTASGDEVDWWISEAMSRSENSVVGIDVEWRPSFSQHQNPVALLQLCTGHHCLIFQLLHSDFIPESLCHFLSDSRLAFVGVGIQSDVDRLADERNLCVRNGVDLRDLAAEKTGLHEMRQKGLAALAMEIIGVEVSKPQSVRMGRWDRFDLTMDQIKYACLDAFISFEIGRRLYYGFF